jgi:UDPglucose 6-dehydrogenase
MKISIIGAGYVGLVTGACFAELGHSVAIINRDLKKTKAINSARPPIFELGLENLLKKHVGKNIIAYNTYSPITDSDLSFICVGTPSNEDGSSDLSMVKAAAASIGESLRERIGSHVVVVKSTVPPGTTQKIVTPTVLHSSGRTDIEFAMNPEFLREGKAIEDFMHPDRIVIGCNSPSACQIVRKVYSGIDAPIFVTNLTTAEMIKYSSNSFLAMKISFANEMGNICKKLGIDVYDVMKGVGMDHRISPHFLNAGAGFGGSCFPKDVNAFVHLAEELGEDPRLLKSVLEVNERQPLKLISLMEKRLGNIEGKKIAILGLAFKDGTDDIRDSRAIPVIKTLLEKGAEVTAYDPKANQAMRVLYPSVEYNITAKKALKDADACIIMTEWPEFKELDKEFEVMRTKVIIEGRKILNYSEREGICW